MVRRRHHRSARTQPLDRLALAVIVGLTLILGLLVLSGDHATARVRNFTWQDRQVGAEDRAFLLTFSRPMDPASVEQNLTLDPPLPGKVSWAGRRMAYTLTEPLPYGKAFTVSLGTARDRYAEAKAEASRFEPFQGQFETRPRAFLYIGVEGDEANRLVLADLSSQERIILTPKNLSVVAFEPYPLGDKVLFSATNTERDDSLLNQQIYTVTTGITPRPPADILAAPPPLWRRFLPQQTGTTSGKLDLILDNNTYQNLKFDLSPDGQIIVVQRANQQDPADFGPWLVRAGAAPQPIETEPGGDFLIAPDSQSLLLLQGEGTAIIDLSDNNSRGPRQPLDFLPNYGRVLDLADDGTAAAMVNFNQDDPEKRFIESLFLVTNQGGEEELLQVTGQILEAQFDPAEQVLYVLASQLVDAASTDDILPTDGYVEQPLLLAITLANGTVNPLLRLPQQRIHMSVAPDGRSLLLDLTDQTASTAAEAGAKIWHLPLIDQPTVSADPLGTAADNAPDADSPAATPALADPEVFPFSGIEATWLP
ncbi:hypothetical protein IQ254_09390 [Nodosilinea sp. LEGE 07088]|uniref:Ig-like domain-containing protein n=1 Tax=Nodosilinea sp. LEGE 07088 TaxID=2777968 RepID=UPI001880F22B|nr:Ig-like domain-containing protein [Nodosilinea sp. LEGE 07088]MBE9137420.1 hypothetical protein [Nodosilinea sp. LEGE 07088]